MPDPLPINYMEFFLVHINRTTELWLAVFIVVWAWPDPLPICYVGKGLGKYGDTCRVNEKSKGVERISHTND